MALDVHASFRDILFVLFCRQMITTLQLRDSGPRVSEQVLRWTIVQLQYKRKEYKQLSDKVLITKARTLRRGGCVGAVVQFKKKGALDNSSRNNASALELSLSSADELVVCCIRGAEDCLESGCVHHAVVTGAIDELCPTTQMALVDMLGTLSEDLRVSAMKQGIAFMYGKRLCVVRREGGSWPFAVVRRKRDSIWLCHA